MYKPPFLPLSISILQSLSLSTSFSLSSLERERIAMATTTPSHIGGEKMPWWLSNRKIVYKYIKEARSLIATREQSEIVAALKLLDAALIISPQFELALELKARSLLYLRRFKDVADMLQDYIPSLKMTIDDSSSSSSVCSDNSSQPLTRERVKLLSGSPYRDPSFKCFSVSDLKKKVMAGIYKNCDKEGQWRYLVLGQACCHLGLLEDAMALLQTGKRMATAVFRRKSISLSEDSFTSNFSVSSNPNSQQNTPPKTEYENITQLISHIKLLLRRKTAAIAALDAGLYSEAIRHFSKIVDGRRAAPQGFLAECYMNKASAYKLAGRIAESISDCNRTLALNPSCIQALSIRASLLETIRCLPDCLHDLEHLKLLYNSILRDRKLPGPVWKRQYIAYREVPGKLCSLAIKIQELKQRIASGETMNVDYYGLIGLSRGCSRSELERAHLLLCLKHKPDKAMNFVERCEFVDINDLDSVKDRARMSALLLYRLLQKGYTNLMQKILDEEAAEKQRKKIADALEATTLQIHQQQVAIQEPRIEQQISQKSSVLASEIYNSNRIIINHNNIQCENKGSSNASVYQGVFCRDLATVGNLLSQVGFNRPLPLKYEALSC